MFKKFLLLCVCVLVIFACAEPGANKIRYGGQIYPGEILMVGYDFFSEFGIEVEHTLFSSGTENNEALISGNVNVNVGSDSKSVALFGAMGDKAVIIGTVQRGNRYSTMVHVDSDYKDWSELKGKKVGTRFGTGAEFVLRKYYDAQPDLSWDDFEWVNIKTEDMIAALASKQIEAFTCWAPTSEIAEAQGIGRMLRNFGDVALTPVCIHTTKAFLDSHRDLLVKFLAAHMKKAKMIKENPAQAGEYAAKAAEERGYNISGGAFKLIFERINFQIEFDDSLIDEIYDTAEFLKDQGQIEEIPTLYWDTSLLADAKKLIQ
jgi:ABC-type nitrate/sulfonate/bicarbonate transport system substrate-binding protein